MAEYIVRESASRDDLRAVLGDAASSEFVPRLKFSKWENEVEFGIEHDLAGMIGAKSFSKTGDVYLYDNNRLALKFYQKPEGYEFELILKQKPGTNKISLPITTKGLRFAYQPPLTEEWKVGDIHRPDGRLVGSVSDTWVLDEHGEPLFHRPENVVGSYAVYHATKKDNFSKRGGYNYGTGKVLHIYRPELIDAVGARAWATLDINTTTGRMTITAPQAFLDAAVYPVIVDPTFGETGYGAGEDYLTQAYIYGRLLACSEAGTVTSISAHAGTQSGSGNLQLGVYDSQATPARVDYTASQAMTTTVEWHTINGTLSGTLAAANYWLCGNSDVAWKLSCDTGSGGDSNYVSQTFGTWPTSLTGWTDANSYDYSFYCTYSTASGYTLACDAGTYAVTGATTIPIVWGKATAWLYGSASTPTDNSTNTANPTTVTPPSGMIKGDLVWVTASNHGTSGDPSMTTTGGQTWNTLTQRNATRCRMQNFWCVFNGTWSASPQVTLGATTNNIVRMLVFRPKGGENSSWAVDVAESSATYSAPGSPYTVTIPSITTVANGALVIATWTSVDDNAWSSLTGSTHTYTALTPAQVRNTSGTYDGSQSHAWMIDATAGATGTISQNQGSGGDVGAYCHIAFVELTNRAIVIERGEYSVTGAAASPLAGYKSVAEAGTYAVTGQDATLTYAGAGTKSLQCDAGSLAVTGQDAGTYYGRRIAADAGTYAIAGEDMWPPVNTCDMYLDFRSGSDGDAMTDARAEGGCWPATPPATPEVYPSSPASVLAIETDAASPDLEGTLVCDGVEHDLADVVQGMRMGHATTDSEEVRIALPSSTVPIVSVGFAFKTTLNAGLYEQYGHSGIQGIADADWAILSTYIDASANVHACLETNGALWPSTPSNGPTLTSDTWYWITIQYNRTAAKAYLRAYLLSTMAQVGSEVEGNLVASPPYVWCVDHGLVASEGNTDSGAYSYYGPFMVDWTDGTFPLLPTTLAEYTLACDGGTYALSGAAGGTLKGSLALAEAGGYSVTGQDAATLFGRLAGAEAGAYSLSGADADVRRTALADAEAGTYAVTGQDAATLFGRKLDAEAGSYAIIGQDAALVYVPGSGAYLLTADGGTYSISGQDAATLRTALLTADTGAYVLTGEDASVLLGARLALDAGVYALTGNAADLFYGRLVSVDTGAYGTTGQDAAMRRTALMPADAGSYTITELEASLVYTPSGAYIIVADGGVYAVTGAAASTLKTNIITAEGITYDVTGADAGTRRAGKVAADAGAYALTGGAAEALLGRLLDAGAGAYALTGEQAALLRAAKVDIGAGSYAITGGAADLVLTHLLDNAALFVLRSTKRLRAAEDESNRVEPAAPAKRLTKTSRSN